MTSALAKIVAKWQGKLSVEQLYQALHSVVFCPGRPKEILLYEMWATDGHDPTHMGRFLVSAAILANHAEDLEKEILPYRENPNSALPALVLLTELTLAKQDRPRSIANMGSIAELIEQKLTPSNINLGCHVARLAVDDEELRSAAAKILKHASPAMNRQLRSPTNRPATSIRPMP